MYRKDKLDSYLISKILHTHSDISQEQNKKPKINSYFISVAFKIVVRIFVNKHVSVFKKEWTLSWQMLYGMVDSQSTVLSERSQTQKARCDMYDDIPTKSTDLAPLEECLSVLQQPWVSSLYGCIHTYNLSNSKGRNKKARSSRSSLTL